MAETKICAACGLEVPGDVCPWCGTPYEAKKTVKKPAAKKSSKKA